MVSRIFGLYPRALTIDQAQLPTATPKTPRKDSPPHQNACLESHGRPSTPSTKNTPSKSGTCSAKCRMARCAKTFQSVRALPLPQVAMLFVFRVWSWWSIVSSLQTKGRRQYSSTSDRPTVPPKTLSLLTHAARSLCRSPSHSSARQRVAAPSPTRSRSAPRWPLLGRTIGPVLWVFCWVSFGKLLEGCGWSGHCG